MSIKEQIENATTTPPSEPLVCDSCGKTGNDVEQCEDPYALEINDIFTLRVMCTKCYNDCAADI